MDFDFTPEEEAFRAELRAFLDEELPAWWKTVFVDDARAMPFTRELCQKLAARGWLTLSWPREHGGAGGSVWQQAVVREEMWAAGEPRGPQYMNLNYIGPLIMRFGTPEQQARLLPPMAAGDVIWCQGFSEPEAGSDLASLKTRAVRDGDHYVVNGQKIWNSYADAPADRCLLLARTNPDVKKQMGISMFLVDMRTPGITVRPIPSMAGKSEFSEIFFDDAVIPVTDRLGEEDKGWTLVGEGLAFERIGIARYARANRVLEHLVAYARDTVVDGRRLADDPAVRARLATLAVHIEAAKLLNYGAISIQAAGDVPAIEASIARIHNTRVEQLAGQVGLEVLGAQGLLLEDDPFGLLDGEMPRQWLESIPVTVAAGSTEVQKNIIAQRGLGLPRSA
jgi:alkylation response protein AidB-like acyl-CoA dehydrogenase